MTWATIGAATVAAAAPSIIGGKQIGPSATPSGSLGVPGQQLGLIGGGNPFAVGGSASGLGLLGQLSQSGTGGVQGVQNALPKLFEDPKQFVGGGSVTPAPTSEVPTLTTGPEKKAGIKGFLSRFGEGIDSTLSSPSKQLGIGLLGEINPNLGLAGLLAGGLFGGR